jgi:hypothetical protein
MAGTKPGHDEKACHDRIDPPQPTSVANEAIVAAGHFKDWRVCPGAA